MDRGAWWATVQGVAKSWTRLSDQHFTFTFGAFSCPATELIVTGCGIKFTCHMSQSIREMVHCHCVQ